MNFCWNCSRHLCVAHFRGGRKASTPSLRKPLAGTIVIVTKARATHMPKHDHEIEPVRPSAGGHPYRQRTKQWPGAHASGSHSAHDTMQTSLPGDNQHPLGLENLGNTCFLNSVVQCLASTPPVARMCREHIHSSNCTSPSHHCIGCALEQLLIDLCPHDGPTSRRRPTPGALVRLTANVIASHTPGQQEDAHEFLRELFDKVHSTMLPDVEMQHIFGGQLHSQTFCSGCGVRPPKRENFLDLSLEIGAEATVRGSLERFAAVEHLCGNEKYACGVCDARVDARKRLRVHAPPQVLVLHLKRFGFDGPGHEAGSTRPIRRACGARPFLHRSLQRLGRRHGVRALRAHRA